MDLSRSQFLRIFAGAGVGALGLSTLGACGDSKDDVIDAPPAEPDASTASCTARNPSATIGTNHGHAFAMAMAITKEDVMAGQMKTYNIQGTSAHPHTITVTAAMFTMLQSNQSVMVTSSLDNNHTHVVTLTCV